MSENTVLRVAGMVPESVTDGPGLRLTLFLQGCPRSCPGCHNPQTQDPLGGYDLSPEDVLSALCRNPLLSGITFSGGEPFLQAAQLVPIARQCHQLGRNVITYSGWYFEELIAANRPDWNRLIAESDLLVDGPYLAEQRNTNLRFRGSENQRIVNVPLSLITRTVHVV